ncbi:MAG: methyltransferase domain-containing protein [Candidatus Pacebacteria bacterium]|nr:methyltransferase domain-containing protein [Candidatus Paceibacterota bacterium]
MLPIYEIIKKPKFILKGIATYLPDWFGVFLPQHSSQFEGKGVRKEFDANDTARACYTLWLRFLVSLRKNDKSFRVPVESVAEIGPGDSLGVGILALLTGSSHYYALDTVKTALNHSNLEMINVLVELLEKRTPIPDDSEFPKAYPKLDSYEFPHDILSEPLLEKSLDKERLKRIKKILEKLSEDSTLLRVHENDVSIDYIVPWIKENNLKGKFDLMVSNATMEHVDDVEGAYKNMSKYIKKGGLFLHAIDYKSHDTAGLWNGHWTYSEVIWRIIRGRSVYLINRIPHSFHIKIAKKYGFNILLNQRYYKENFLSLDDLVEPYRTMDPEDIQTSVGVIGGELKNKNT